MQEIMVGMVQFISGASDVAITLKEFSDKIHWAWEETYHRGNIDALDEIYAHDVVIHVPPFRMKRA